MKVLVTGGAGFIGSNFVHYLVSKAYGVVVVDKLTYAGSKENLQDILPSIDFIHGDICDKNLMRDSLKDIDCLVHMAAESHNTRSETDPDVFYKTNIEGTKTVMQCAADTNVKKIIHISTDEVYGSINDGYFKETDKKKGDSQATSAYSKSKSLADDIAMGYGEKGYPVVVIRPTNNFGPWQYPEKALPRWITNILSGDKIPLWGKGLQIRDWLYAPVTSEAIEFIMLHGKNGNAYNLAANHNPEITNFQAAKMISEILGKNPDGVIEFIPDPRPNHDFRYALVTEKLEQLGFKPNLDIHPQFKETVEWYKLNAKWWLSRKEEAESIYK